ncbi:amidohydrolase family protein [Butyrivibrio sp. MC2013]|uniref:amidohydrolase family protein n=1 Tax=Butyrivibrio sp. MC2013 TaxID=1280686 RepID=UPI000407387A|nr:amidohydrolase [Butyrivibrio sp. MC2013]
MQYRFKNARILTMEEGRQIFKGEVWVSDDKISFVGTDSEAEQRLSEISCSWDREIDCAGDLIMPGFKDAHTHSAMTLMRSRADDLPLDEWLNKQIFPVEAHMTGEDCYHLTRLAVLEYLTSGITAIFEMYLTPETIAAACRDTGMRCVQTGCYNSFMQSAELVEDMYNKLNSPEDPLNTYILGFHAEYTSSPEVIDKMAALAHKYQAPVYTHLAETAAETKGCVERYGMSPVKYLSSRGIFDYGGGGYHMVHVSEDDMEIIKEKGLYVVTNPGSNSKLASGIAPISDYMKHDIPVAIGTDGPASNNALDMFREMFLVTALGKLREEDASAIDAMEVLKMATVNGARSMGLEDCDCLAEGKQADMIRIDLHQPNMQPINNIAKNIVYSGSKQNVKMTMIRGVIRYEDGVFNIGDDPENIYRQAELIKERIDKTLV